ncbi:unnamed protein product [Clonostachys rosea]|uniref:GST N-terminal domain-containing protein n=1 Tax=Bionectria ochroleuca TaxID=29856 RepID=A0ABY6UXZ0_BIOOC|nr:unnamed protein product [Clonostachys rosea]
MASRDSFSVAGPGAGHDLNAVAVGQASYRVNVNVPVPGLDLSLDGYPATSALDDASPFVQQHAHAHPHAHSQHRQQAAHSSLQQQIGHNSATNTAGGGQFGILAPATVPHHDAFASEAVGARLDAAPVGKGPGHLPSKMVIDPPGLDAWRERLFNVDEMIVLTNEQFETYFPHVDNVYSHRSTQRYKRKPFVSHYWDCRMKGRPPGTPKSDDPNKKKRKRTARERDLCDVKIKITEYAPGAQIMLDSGTGDPSFMPPPVDVGTGQRFWTIQRVNGNGGNGKGDGVAGPHRHTLAKSDEIKKNSIQRFLAQQEKEVKKSQKPPQHRATGAAMATIRKHNKDSELKLYSACFCPFSQRVWVALEAKGIAYQYCEINPYNRPAPSAFLEGNPGGCVPIIRQGDWTCAESGIILEYLEDIDENVPLHPTDPKQRANSRVWTRFIDSEIVTAFFNLLRAEDLAQQAEATDQLQSAIARLVVAAHEEGPFFFGDTLSLVDIHFAPFAIRLSRVIQPLRGWLDPLPDTRWHRWLSAMEGNAHVKATTSGRELYIETTELLAQKPTVGPGHTA